MTISELHKILDDALEAGHGDATVVFDAEARSFECHLVDVDGASLEIDQEILSSLSNAPRGILILTTKYH